MSRSSVESRGGDGRGPQSPGRRIVEVRIELAEDNPGSTERLRAFSSITFDDLFVIRGLKIIEGAKGFFVAMPSRKLTDRCGHCGTKNHLRSRFCNQCGSRLDENRADRDSGGPSRLHAEIAYPIDPVRREEIQSVVLASYAEELERSKQPDYVSRHGDPDPSFRREDEVRGGLGSPRNAALAPTMEDASVGVIASRIAGTSRFGGDRHPDWLAPDPELPITFDLPRPGGAVRCDSRDASHRLPDPHDPASVGA